jgi:hypothetical protein
LVVEGGVSTNVLYAVNVIAAGPKVDPEQQLALTG